MSFLEHLWILKRRLGSVRLLSMVLIFPFKTSPLYMYFVSSYVLSILKMSKFSLQYFEILFSLSFFFRNIHIQCWKKRMNLMWKVQPGGKLFQESFYASIHTVSKLLSLSLSAYQNNTTSVSYTHLTLPTILLV